MHPGAEFRLHLDASRRLTSGRINTHVDACERTQIHAQCMQIHADACTQTHVCTCARANVRGSSVIIRLPKLVGYKLWKDTPESSFPIPLLPPHV